MNKDIIDEKEIKWNNLQNTYIYTFYTIWNEEKPNKKDRLIKVYNVNELNSEIDNINILKENRKDSRYKILKFIIFIIYSIIMYFFILEIYTYSINNKYEDDDVYIKEMNIWYNVYKKGELKEVSFFNWNLNNDKELLSYINNNILFTQWKNIDNSNVFIMKDPTNINWKTKINEIENIYIKKIYKVSNENYIVLYVEYNEKNKIYEYCFLKNSLSFEINKNKFCLHKSEYKYDFSLNHYDNYFLIWLNEKIYFFDSLNNQIHMIINMDSKIIDISKNQNNDFKILTNKWVKIILNNYINYYLIKRIHDKQSEININISELL